MVPSPPLCQRDENMGEKNHRKLISICDVIPIFRMMMMESVSPDQVKAFEIIKNGQGTLPARAVKPKYISHSTDVNIATSVFHTL